MDVVVVGSIVIDLISYVEKFPADGETVFGYEFLKGFGGKGGNQCVMAKLLGSKVALVGKIGDDLFGRDYLARIKDLSINSDHVYMSNTLATGTASITVRKQDGQNQIVISPGANYDLSVEDIDNARHIITKSKVILCQLEIPIKSTYHALRIASDNNVISIFNPAPIPDSGLDLSNMPPVTVFCPNETEASLITKMSISSVQDSRKVVEYFLNSYSHKIRWPMVTLGHLGVVFGDSATGKIVHVPAPTVTAIDSTGAGDCFAGSLAYYFANYPDISVEEKIKRSIHLASLSVQKPGTQSSFPTNFCDKNVN